jgi:hypothetical protein
MDRLFAGVRAPSTLGTFHALVHLRPRPPARPSGRPVPDPATAHSPLLAGAEQVAYLDLDDTVRATHGYAKQGAGYGYSGAESPAPEWTATSNPSSAITA